MFALAQISRRPPADAGAPFATVNLYTGAKERAFPFLDAAEFDRAIEEAHRAFLEWRARPRSGP